MAKPDDRSDNLEKIQSNIGNTIKNFRENEQYLAEHAEEISSQEKQQLKAKNQKRLSAIEGFREEAKDEAGQAD